MLDDLTFRSRLYGVVYLLLAGLMLVYGLRQRPLACLPPQRGLCEQLQRWPQAVPSAMGLLTGLNLCPPFLLALSSAAMAGSLLTSLAFFTAFFMEISAYLMATPLLARMLFLYPAFLFLMTFSSGTIILAVWRVLSLITTGSLLA